jgi:hypothetical protein
MSNPTSDPKTFFRVPNLPPDPAAAQSGGADRNRTDDLLRAKQALSQLSYGPVSGIRRQGSETGRKSNR